MPMHGNPSQTMPHNAPLQGSCLRPNPIPSSSPSTSSRTQHNKHMHANPSRTKPYNSPSQGSCTRSPVPNHPNPSRPSTSSMAQQSMRMHVNPSQSMPYNSHVQGSRQNPSSAYVGSFSVNETFKSKQHLWGAVDSFHMKENIEIAVTSSSKSELVVRCKNQRCKWKLHATPRRVGSNWTIKTCPYSHTCHGPASQLNQPELTVEIIAQEICKDIQQDLELKIIKLHELVLKKFPGAQPSYKNLWHAREIVIAELFGSWEESYALLPRLFEAIKASNPETKVDLQSDSMAESGHQQFKRVAWAFGPCINAYLFLRPVISVSLVVIREVRWQAIDCLRVRC